MKWLENIAVYQICKMLIEEDELRSYIILILGLVMFFSILIISVDTAIDVLIEIYK